MRRLLPIACLGLIALASCKKDDPEPAGINGVEWAETNVDAPGAFAATPNDPGRLYQWGIDIAYPIASQSDWNTTAYDGNSWDNGDGPCPEGWRLPTREEVEKLIDETKVTYQWIDASASQSAGMKYTDNSSGKSIFLPAVGYLNYENGALTEAGTNGNYWTGEASSNASKLWLERDATDRGNSNRNFAFSVRCVKK